MNLVITVILGIVEGVTEFLPISSTGHLILASHILGASNGKIMATFEIAIQIGPILAVSWLYYKRLISQKALFYKACIGFIPTGILGIALYPTIKSFLQSELITVTALFFGGIAILAIEWFFEKKYAKKPKNLSSLTYKDSISIGLIQSLAMIPGVSRSASSIFGGMALGLDRKSAVEFSFFLAIPTMLVATSFEILKNASTFTTSDLTTIIIGVLISFLVAVLAIKWLLKYIQTNNFFWFGIYRMLFSILYAIFYLK